MSDLAKAIFGSLAIVVSRPVKYLSLSYICGHWNQRIWAESQKSG